MTLSGVALSCDCVWRAEAGFGDVEDINAAGQAMRRGMKDVEGLALEMLASGGKMGQ